MCDDPPARLRTQKRAIAILREVFGGKAASARAYLNGIGLRFVFATRGGIGDDGTL